MSSRPLDAGLVTIPCARAKDMASVDESEGEAGIAGQGRGLGSTGTTLQHVLF